MRIRVLFISFLFASALISTAFSQTKHALIVAIGNYLNWPTISSLRDVGLIETALQRQGFQDIKIVSDSSATVSGIEKAFDDLTMRAHPGDVVVIHFSSHGEQIQDDNGDETDGLDETIVTYNAVLPTGRPVSKKEYDRFQANYFRDDKLGGLINILREKLGKNGDVLVFMDLCHSGSGTRGLAKVRGGQPPLVTVDFVPGQYKKEGSDELVPENNSASASERNLASYVVFSAAESGELNYETLDENDEYVGSLTFAISKALSNSGTSVPTYRSLFSAVQSVMNSKSPNQHSVLEGNGIDRTIFGGKFIKQQPFIAIRNIQGTKLSLDAGKIQGVDTGVKIFVYPAGTTDTLTAKKLATGTVIEAGNYGSVVKLDRLPGIKTGAEGWAFISAPVYRIEPVKIEIISGNARGKPGQVAMAKMNALKNTVGNMPLVRFDKNPELLIRTGEVYDSISIASNGSLFATVKHANASTGLLDPEIQRYLQYRYLRDLNIYNDNVTVEIKMLPFINGLVDSTYMNNGLISNPVFQAGEQFVLWVYNPGLDDVYFNILDIQPDGVINKVFPDKGKNIYPADLRIAPRSAFLFSRYPVTVGPPFGTEIFKIFVSNQKIDLEEIANTKGSGTRGNLTVLENLVKTSYHAGTRGVEGAGTGNADGSCFNMSFQITPKN